MNNESSMDRIVSYFHALARKEFSFNGKNFPAYEKLVVSEKAFRSYTCPAGCGACCMKCSLVWDKENEFSREEILVEINGVTRSFFQNAQREHKGHYCQYLLHDGRCGIYQERPLPCRFELFKFVHATKSNTARALVRLPGRSWALTRIDDTKGGACEIMPYNPELTASHIADLLILQGWMESFHIDNDCKEVMYYLKTGPYDIPLTLHRDVS